jgi:hypothetical protein
MDLEKLRLDFEAKQLDADQKKADHRAAQRRFNQLQQEMDGDIPDPPEDFEDNEPPEWDLADEYEFAGTQREHTKTAVAEAERKANEARLEYEAARDIEVGKLLDDHRAGVVHWDRRFHTSLAIAHGAAFAAIVNHAFDHEAASLALRWSLAPLIVFGFGLLLGGAIPLILAKTAPAGHTQAALELASSTRKEARTLALFSASLFGLGVMLSVVGVVALAFPPSTHSPTPATTAVLSPSTAIQKH